MYVPIEGKGSLPEWRESVGRPYLLQHGAQVWIGRGLWSVFTGRVIKSQSATTNAQKNKSPLSVVTGRSSQLRNRARFCNLFQIQLQGWYYLFTKVPFGIQYV